jgi:hypothetical protein
MIIYGSRKPHRKQIASPAKAGNLQSDGVGLLPLSHYSRKEKAMAILQQYLQTQKVIRLMTDQSITLEAMEGMTVDQLIKVDNMDPGQIRHSDPRDLRVRDIMYALEHEPVDMETAIELIDELAGLGIDLENNPPEFGSAGWFEAQPEIEF